MGTPWKKHEIEIIEANKDALVRACEFVVSLLPDRMPSRILAQCQYKPIDRHADKIPWKAEEVQFLRENIATMSLEAIARKLGAKRGRIVTKVRNLGLSPRGVAGWLAERTKPWTDELVAALRQEVPERGMSAFAAKYHVQYQRVARKVEELGIVSKRGCSKQWTQAEIAQVRELAASMTRKDIAKTLGRSHQSIAKITRALGIRAKDGRGLNKPKRTPRAYTRRSAPSSEPSVPKRAATKITRSMDICPIHRCPVSNWQEHKQRLNCSAIPPYMQNWRPAA